MEEIRQFILHILTADPDPALMKKYNLSKAEDPMPTTNALIGLLENLNRKAQVEN